MSANLRAFLALLRWCEGTAGPDGYRTRFGGGLFDSFSDHPGGTVTRTLGGKPITSSAAGAYQFLESTWRACQAALKLPDFSPESQDLAAIYLVQRRGALEDVEAGRLQTALAKCAQEWASLPGSPYGQPTKTLEQCVEMYRRAGGFLESAYSVTPAEEITAAPPPPDAQPAAPIREAVPPIYPPVQSLKDIVTGKAPEMPAPFALIAFEALSTLLPTLIRMKSSSPRGEANAQLAEKTMSVIRASVGASNDQEAVEKIRSDPAALQTADAAVKERYFELVEAGGGGIAGAREFTMKLDEKPFYERSIFWISLVFLLPVFMLMVDFLFVHPQLYTENNRTQIVTAILAILGLVGTVWFGTTVRNAAKDDAIKALSMRQ